MLVDLTPEEGMVLVSIAAYGLAQAGEVRNLRAPEAAALTAALKIVQAYNESLVVKSNDVTANARTCSALSKIAAKMKELK